MKRIIAAIALAVATLFGISAVAPSPAVAGNGTSNFYLGPENCWAGNKANVQTTNWDEGSWQSYHVWVYRAPGYTGSIYMYMDGSLKHSGAAEFYINVPDHKSHKISLKAGTSSCYYYQ